MIQVVDLSKNYYQPRQFDFIRYLLKRPTGSATKALQEVSFTVNDGETVGLIGPNGAGKTTLIKLLTGLLRPTGGTVKIDTFTPSDLTREFKLGISLFRGNVPVLDDGVLVEDSFNEKLKIYNRPHLKNNQPLQQLIKLSRISRFMTKTPDELSLGQRTWVELIYSLVHFPRYIFLDEPTIGLDLSVQLQFKKLVGYLIKNYRPTLIITSHDLQTVIDVCPRIILINKGRLLLDRPTETVIKNAAADKKIVFTLKSPLVKKLTLPAGAVYRFPKLTVLSPREKLRADVIYWSKQLEYLDIDISEPPIEQIFAKYYR